MLDAAVIDGALPMNPVAATSRLKGDRKDVQALSEDDIHAVRAAVDAWCVAEAPRPRPAPDMADIIDVLLATGCRLGEVLALRWTELDLEATPPTLTVNGTIKTGDRQGDLPQVQAEVGASRRTLALPDFAATMQRRRRDEQAAEPAGRGLRHPQRHVAPGDQHRATLASHPCRHRPGVGDAPHLPQGRRDTYRSRSGLPHAARVLVTPRTPSRRSSTSRRTAPHPT